MRQKNEDLHGNVPDKSSVALLLIARIVGEEIARIGDQQVGCGQAGGIGIVAADRGADVGQLGEQLQKLQPGEVDVMILAGGNQMYLHGSSSLSHVRARLSGGSGVASAKVRA